MIRPCDAGRGASLAVRRHAASVVTCDPSPIGDASETAGGLAMEVVRRASPPAVAVLAAAALLAACGHAAMPAPREPEKSVQLNGPGVAVDVEAALVDGYVTVVDFWSESCGACVVVGGMLAVQVAQEPRVLIRKVDVGDSDTAVARAYQIGALPHYRIYDKHRRPRYILVGNDCLQAPELARNLAAEP